MIVLLILGIALCLTPTVLLAIAIPHLDDQPDITQEQS